MYTDRKSVGDERQEARIRNLITAYAVKPLDKAKAGNMLGKPRRGCLTAISTSLISIG